MHEKRGKKRTSVKDRDWILKKKEVRADRPNGRVLCQTRARADETALEISDEGQRGCTARLEVHGPQAQDAVLSSPSCWFRCGSVCWVLSMFPIMY